MQATSLTQRKHTLNVLWVAMAGAVSSYWFVHLVLLHRPVAAITSSAFPEALIAGSAVCYTGAWWWHGRTIRSVGSLIDPTMFMRLSPQDRVGLQDRLQNAAVVCLALFESPAVLGLINTMVQAPAPHLFEWLAGASLVFLLTFRLQGYPAIFDMLEKLDPGSR